MPIWPIPRLGCLDTDGRKKHRPKTFTSNGFNSLQSEVERRPLSLVKNCTSARHWRNILTWRNLQQRRNHQRNRRQQRRLLPRRRLRSRLPRNAPVKICSNIKEGVQDLLFNSLATSERCVCHWLYTFGTDRDWVDQLPMTRTRTHEPDERNC